MLVVLALLVAATGVSCAPSAASPCGRRAAPPARFAHVVVIVEENRTWSRVGLGFNSTRLPFLHGLARRCAYFDGWNETNPRQNSLTQYIGMTSGVNNPSTVNDCSPSRTCHSTDNNIFRQVRAAGKKARTYVEGATKGCSASGNAAKHIPALYYWGGHDRTHCTTEVRPLRELRPDALPTFTMIIPNECHDGHNCGDRAVDSFAHTALAPIMNSSAYKAGTTAIFVVYDESRPVPNLVIAPTAHAGSISKTGSHAAMLKTIELLLHLPVMRQGQLRTAADLRRSAHI